MGLRVGQKPYEIFKEWQLSLCLNQRELRVIAAHRNLTHTYTHSVCSVKSALIHHPAIFNCVRVCVCKSQQ